MSKMLGFVIVVGCVAALIKYNPDVREVSETFLDKSLETIGQSRQLEAKRILREIYVLENDYYQTHDRYTERLQDMGLDPSGDTYYSYSVRVRGSWWEATAIANLDDDATFDRWIIDNAGRLTCVSDDTRY